MRILERNPELMVLKLRLFFDEFCSTGKVRHRSPAQAQAHLDTLVHGGLDAGPGVLNVYRCPECQAWHVGHGRYLGLTQS